MVDERSRSATEVCEAYADGLVSEMYESWDFGGALAYDAFPAADRPRLVKDWEEELATLKRAIKGDEERLARAATAKGKQHFTRLIAEYKQKQARHEVNDPPSIKKKEWTLPNTSAK